VLSAASSSLADQAWTHISVQMPFLVFSTCAISPTCTWTWLVHPPSGPTFRVHLCAAINELLVNSPTLQSIYLRLDYICPQLFHIPEPLPAGAVKNLEVIVVNMGLRTSLPVMAAVTLCRLSASLLLVISVGIGMFLAAPKTDISGKLKRKLCGLSDLRLKSICFSLSNPASRNPMMKAHDVIGNKKFLASREVLMGSDLESDIPEEAFCISNTCRDRVERG